MQDTPRPGASPAAVELVLQGDDEAETQLNDEEWSYVPTMSAIEDPETAALEVVQELLLALGRTDGNTPENDRDIGAAHKG